mgnify:CR=1 FL=1
MKKKERRLTDRQLIEGFVFMANNQEQFPQFEELCKLIHSAYEEIQEKDLDRERVLAAIQAEQRHISAEANADDLNHKSDEILDRMFEGKDLKGLLALDKIFREVRSDFKGSEGFKTIRQVLKDRIADYKDGRTGKAQEGGRP